MKTALAWLGAIHFILFFLGAVGCIDYHVCIKEPGKCAVGVEK